ncbi:MAG: hypothetical protein ACREXX_06750 [Gammaproteobacteria bacterium]
MLDGGDELQGVAELGTVFHIDLEHPFKKALPGFWFRAGVRHSKPLAAVL